MPPRKPVEVEEEKRVDPRLHSERKSLEEKRSATEKLETEFYHDRRGGVYHVIDGKRVHSKDLTEEQKITLHKPKEE